MGSVIPLTPPLRVAAQSPAGTYGFPPPDATRPRVDITPGLDGYRVWLFGRPYRSFASLTNASRCASALMELDRLGALPPGLAPLEAVK